MLEIAARGKINWTLDIVGRRPDGYHLMDMLMSSVELHDTLYLEQGEGLSLELISQEKAAAPLPADEQNLVLKAARALQAATGSPKGAAMRLIKRVPVGAGMGGGSGDAAAALVGLQKLWGTALPKEQLLAIGVSLGADVPFALTGGFQRVQGIGEKLLPLPSLKPIWLVITQPCLGLSTPEIFRAFDSLPEEAIVRPDQAATQEALLGRDLAELTWAMGNVMQPVSIERRPLIQVAIQALEAAGAVRGMMTGSGSAVYGVFENEEKARIACEQLRGQWARTYVTQTAEAGWSLKER